MANLTSNSDPCSGTTSRRQLLFGLIGFSAPAIVRWSSLMPVQSPWLTIEEFLAQTGWPRLGIPVEDFQTAFRSDGSASILLKPTLKEVQIGYGKLFPPRQRPDDPVVPAMQWPNVVKGDRLLEYRWRVGMRI